MVTWGISGGGPHALACAALAPDLFAAAATLASVGPYGEDGFDFFEDMGTQNVEDFRLTATDPQASAAKAAEEWPLLVSATPESLRAQWSTILTPTDAGALTGEVAEYLIAMLKSGLATGPEGYIDDGVAFTRPWGFKLSEITIPVQLWQGRQDRFVPYGHGKWLSEHIPGVEAHLTEEDGHLTLLNRISEIHEWLLRYL
jgi:pimeloyl-ACP methyl ester carboxylesterase